MRHLLIGVSAAATIAVIGPLRAQVPPPNTPQSLPRATSTAPVQRYPFRAPTPEDAYRKGLINRWELERYEGSTPQALQGPSVNGARGAGSPRHVGTKLSPTLAQLVEGMAPTFPLPEWSTRLVCSVCGSREVDFVVSGESR
jgi:hypothetical protein